MEGFSQGGKATMLVIVGGGSIPSTLHKSSGVDYGYFLGKYSRNYPFPTFCYLTIYRKVAKW